MHVYKVININKKSRRGKWELYFDILQYISNATKCTRIHKVLKSDTLQSDNV